MNHFKSKLQPIRTDTGNRLNMILQNKNTNDQINYEIEQQEGMNLTDRQNQVKKQFTQEQQAEIIQIRNKKQSFTRNVTELKNGNLPDHQESFKNKFDNTYLRVQSYSKQDSSLYNGGGTGNHSALLKSKNNNMIGRIQGIAISSLHSDENGGGFFKNTLHQTTIQKKTTPILNQDDYESALESQRAFQQQISNAQSLNQRNSMFIQTPQVQPRSIITYNERHVLGGYQQPSTPLYPKLNNSISPQKFQRRKHTLTSQGSAQIQQLHQSARDHGTASMKRFSQVIGQNNQLGMQNIQKRISNNLQYFNPSAGDSQSENEGKLASFKKIDINQKNIKEFQNLIKDQKKEAKKQKKEREKHKEEQKQTDDNNKDVQNLKLKQKLTIHSQISEGGFGIKRQRAINRSLTLFNNQTKQTSMTSVDDSDDDEDPIQKLENNIKRSIFTIYPDSKFRFVWDLISSILIIFWSLFIPIQYAFEEFNPEFLSVADPLIELWFIFDLILNFNTGYYHKGLIIMERDMIIKQYLKSWFVLDFIGCIPYSWVLNNLKGTNFSMSPNELRKSDITVLILENLKVIRLWRFIKLDKLMNHVQEQISSDLTNSFFRFGKLMMITFFVAHWLACIFYTVAASMLTQKENWITDAQLQDADISEKYVNSLYWTITTMATVGYGDIKIQNTEERLVVILVMLVAGAIYAYIINDIGHIVSRYNFLANQYREKMMYVNQFLTSKQIPKDLIQKINKYLQYNWELKKQIKIEEKEFMELLNDDLRDRFTIYLNGQVLHKIKVLYDFKIDFKSQLTFILNKKSYSVDDNLVVEDDLGDEIFYITQGKVAIVHRATYTYIADLHKDEYFGEIGFFADCPRTCTVKSRDFTDVITIKKQAFLDIASMFPDAIDSYYMIHDRISVQQKEYTQLKLSCYLCNQKNHIAIDCKRFKNIAGNMQIMQRKHDKKLLKRSMWGLQTNQDNNSEESFENMINFYKTDLLVPRTSIESINNHKRQKSKGKKTPNTMINKEKFQYQLQDFSEVQKYPSDIEEIKNEVFDDEYQTKDMSYIAYTSRDKTKIIDEENLNNLTEVDMGLKNETFTEDDFFEEKKFAKYHQNDTNLLINQYLEDIKEDDAAYEDEFDEESRYAKNTKTPLLKESSNRLSTGNFQNFYNMRSSVDRINALVPQYKSSKKNVQKQSQRISNSMIQQYQQQQLQNNQQQHSNQRNGEILNQKINKIEQFAQYPNFDESKEKINKNKPSKKTLADQTDIEEQKGFNYKQKKIQPFRGIVKNALQKRLKIKTGKYFQEDSLEDLANLIIHEGIPLDGARSPLINNRQFSKIKQTERQSIHTLISSRSSVDGKHMSTNAINLIRKFTKMSTKRKRRENSIHSDYSNPNENSPSKSKFNTSDKKRRQFQRNLLNLNNSQQNSNQHVSNLQLSHQNSGIYQPIIKVENNNQNIVFNFSNGGNYHIHYHQTDGTINNDQNNTNSNNNNNNHHLSQNTQQSQQNGQQFLAGVGEQLINQNHRPHQQNKKDRHTNKFERGFKHIHTNPCSRSYAQLQFYQLQCLHKFFVKKVSSQAIKKFQHKKYESKDKPQ